jgi:N-acetylglutamate synthase-like GNAT family acetyltransferase
MLRSFKSMRPTWRIRKAVDSDIPGILRCLRVAFEPFRTAYTVAAFNDTVLSEPAARDRLRSMSVFIAEDSNSTLIGTIAATNASDTEGHLRGMAVLPDWQGTGVAGELLGHALHELRTAGCRRVTLDTTVPLRRAVRFYEKQGFTRSGKVTDFFGMPLYEFYRILG